MKRVGRILLFVMAALAAAWLSGCGIEIKYAQAGAVSASDSSPARTGQGAATPMIPSTETSGAVSPDTTAGPAGTQASPEGGGEPSPAEPSPKMVPYTGTVEHLFFHPVIAYPELAFDGDSKEKGLDMYMLTVGEYKKILESLYRNNYIIVNLNDVWREYRDAAGESHMIRATIMVPEGKKPIVLSYDDVSYYNYMIKNGFTYKLVVKAGEIWSFGRDPEGRPIYSQDLDAITILDKFVREHPDFSLNGAKGCICLTGYEGILGYRTMTDIKNKTPESEAARQKEIEAVKPVVELLKKTGWYFGCHSWGHIDLSKSSLEAVMEDTQRWLDEVGSLVGPTKLYFYPFGARPDGDDVHRTGEIFKYLHSAGFRVFASVGSSSFAKIKSDIPAVICDRMHADGSTLRTQRERYLKFYDAKTVFDAGVRPDYGVSW